MTMAGRPRDQGERYPSGKLKGAAKFRGTSPALVRRMIERAKDGAADPRIASVPGRLHLEGRLSERAYAAALSYAELRGRFHRVMGYRPRSAASPSYEEGYASAGGPENEHVILQVRMDHTAVLKLLSPADVIDLDAMCIDDRYLASWQVAPIAKLLDKLVVHFRN